jgi:hypothetical protein
VSEYPSTLGDLADVEARLDAAVSRLERRLTAAANQTDQEVAELREQITAERAWSEMAAERIVKLETQVAELERLWIVARENPELVRELAVEALKGREKGS